MTLPYFRSGIIIRMTTLGQLATTLDNGITFWVVLLLVGPMYIRAYADLIRARRERQPSDDD